MHFSILCILNVESLVHYFWHITWYCYIYNYYWPFCKLCVAFQWFTKSTHFVLSLANYFGFTKTSKFPDAWKSSLPTSLCHHYFTFFHTAFDAWKIPWIPALTHSLSLVQTQLAVCELICLGQTAVTSGTHTHTHTRTFLRLFSVWQTRTLVMYCMPVTAEVRCCH